METTTKTSTQGTVWQTTDEKPFVTVLVPIRNEAAYIEECLQAIAQQDYGRENFEVLVLDGMSDDGTREIVRRFVGRYANMQMVDNPNRYVPYALNIGIRQARGEIIARMDGHAVMERDYLTQCVRALQSTGAECVGGQIASVNRTTLGRAIALGMSSTFGVGNSRFRTAGHDGPVDSLAFGVYHRDTFAKIGLFDEAMVRCQDDEFNFRLRNAGGTVYLTSKMRCRYYPRNSLKKLWRQYFGYGFFKVRLFQRYPSLMRPRHFVPSGFVVALLGSLAVAAGFGLIWPLATLLMAYGLAGGFFAARLAARHGAKFFFLLPPIFATLHLSYGSGFLWGLLRFNFTQVESGTIPGLPKATGAPANKVKV